MNTPCKISADGYSSVQSCSRPAGTLGTEYFVGDDEHTRLVWHSHGAIRFRESAAETQRSNAIWTVASTCLSNDSASEYLHPMLHYRMQLVPLMHIHANRSSSRIPVGTIA